jgi:hypothetical protein
MLASLADLKIYLQLLTSTTAADAELTRLLDVASVSVEQYLERTLLSASHTERRSGSGLDTLLLRDTPVSAVASLTIDGVAVAASNGTTDGYLFENQSIFLTCGRVFTPGRRNVLVTYTGGYAANAMPADITHAVIEIAAQAYREKEWIGFTSKSLAGETVAFARQGWPDSARQALSLYRRIYVCD